MRDGNQYNTKDSMSRLCRVASNLLSRVHSNLPGSHEPAYHEKPASGFMSRKRAITYFVIFSLVFGARVAHSDVYINAEETVDGVVFSYFGVVDTTNLTVFDTFFRNGDEGFIYPSRGQFVAATDGTTVVRYSDMLIPNTGFGSGPFNISGIISSGSDTFGLYLIPGTGGDTEFFLPSTYVSGANFSGSVLFPSSTLGGLGVDTTPFSIALGTSGNTIFFFNILPTPEELWLTQALFSGIPMNQAVGQVASTVHNTSTRDFSSRLFRARSRWVPLDGDGMMTQADNSDFFQRRGREVAASRFFRMQRQLEMDTTINLNGANENSANRSGDSGLDAPVISDEVPMLSVTRQAGACLDPGCLAAGENWVLFGAADFGQVELDNLGGNPALDSYTRSTSLGLEYQVNENLALGVGWSHSWNETDFSGNLGGADIEGDAGIVYASYFRNNLWGDLMYSYGNYKADIHRNTGFGTTARAEPDIDTHRTDLNLGYNIGHCGGKIVHGPTFSASYTDGSLDGYTETGAGNNNMTFAAQDFESFITTAGWQFNTCLETNYGPMRPQLRVGYGHEHLDQDQRIQATSPAIAVPTLTRFQHDPGHGWLDLGGGVSWQIKDNVSLFLDYNGQFLREDAAVHVGTVRARVAF